MPWPGARRGIAHGRIQQVITRFTAPILLSNIASVGIEANLSVAPPDMPGPLLWRAINSVFAAIYVLELMYKFYVSRVDDLRSSKFLPDTLFALMAIVDSWILGSLDQTNGVRSISTLLRTIRLCRFFKFMPWNPDLRLLLGASVGIARIMIPMAAALMALVYFFALLVTAVSDVNATDAAYSRDQVWSGSEYWGSVPSSMLTMFQIATGDRWAHAIVRPLFELSPLYLLIFIPYVLVTLIAFRATLIAKLCDHVVQLGSAAESRLESLEDKTKNTISHLQSNFVNDKKRHIREDSSEFLNYTEVVRFASVEANRKLLTTLNVPVGDLGELFYILDPDQTEKVAIPQFFSSILRLKGPAMGRHVTTLQMTASQLACRATVVSSRVAKLDQMMDTVNGRFTELAKSYGLRRVKDGPKDATVITAMNEPMNHGRSQSASANAKRGKLRERYLMRKESRRKSSPFILLDS